MSYDAVIVGSGPSGLATALGLEGCRVAIVDVGLERPAPQVSGNLYESREAAGDGLEQVLLGTAYESLDSLYAEFSNPKLKAPALAHTARDRHALSPLEGAGFVGIQSFARGGLANAWGAGAYVYDAQELARFPIGVDDLAPYFERLTPIVGVSGCDDDLAPYFGSAAGLDPPVELDAISRLFLRRYEAHRDHFQQRGLHVGRSRLAVTTRDRPGRPAYGYRGVDFFEPEPAVFNPARALEEWLRRDDVEMLSGRLALSFRETEGDVTLLARHLETGTLEEHRARCLLLAAGTLGSAKLVLASRKDHDTELPILDNPISYVPMLAPECIGRAQETRFYGGGQLNLLYRGPATLEPVQGSFYGMSGVLRSDFLMQLPFAARDLVGCGRGLAPALAILQMFYADAGAVHRLRLRPDGVLAVRAGETTRGRVERLVLRAVRRLGFLGLPGLCQYPPAGSSFHYAGTLPMRAQPTHAYETDVSGRLTGTKSVYVCDAATFPHLPAKNLTFTAMANAMRIAAGVAEKLRR